MEKATSFWQVTTNTSHNYVNSQRTITTHPSIYGRRKRKRLERFWQCSPPTPPIIMSTVNVQYLLTPPYIEGNEKKKKKKETTGKATSFRQVTPRTPLMIVNGKPKVRTYLVILAYTEEGSANRRCVYTSHFRKTTGATRQLIRSFAGTKAGQTGYWVEARTVQVWLVAVVLARGTGIDLLAHWILLGLHDLTVVYWCICMFDFFLLQCNREMLTDKRFTGSRRGHVWYWSACALGFTWSNDCVLMCLFIYLLLCS